MQLQVLEVFRKPETRKTSRSKRRLSISLAAELIGLRRCDAAEGTMHEPLPLRTATAADIPRLQHVLHRDYETRSRLFLKVVGAHRYAADGGTEVQCCAYAVDDGPVQLWRPAD